MQPSFTSRLPLHSDSGLCCEVPCWSHSRHSHEPHQGCFCMVTMPCPACAGPNIFGLPPKRRPGSILRSQVADLCVEALVEGAASNKVRPLRSCCTQQMHRLHPEQMPAALAAIPSSAVPLPIACVFGLWQVVSEGHAVQSCCIASALSTWLLP